MRYGPKTAVNGLSLSAPQGAVTALIGPNGAGKTSTVEVCVGLRRATSGTVEVLGAPAAQTPTGRARIGVMLQDGGLYNTARPLEFAEYVASLYPDPRDPAELLSTLGIDPGLRTPIRRLSGGEQQRVKCACALVGRPDLVFLDEPTAGLDPLARRGIHDLVRGLVDDGTSIVLTTHVMDDVERLASHVVVMTHGRAVRSGTVDELVGRDDAIVFRAPPGANLNELRAALPEHCTVIESHPGSYTVDGAADPMALSAVASWAAQHGGRTSDVSVGRRSLEDVVIELIGEPL